MGFTVINALSTNLKHHETDSLKLIGCTFMTNLFLMMAAIAKRVKKKK